jgi:EAL domain-containing protein (putative c-di-GMP-specific phosphodiesterase class I)
MNERYNTDIKKLYPLPKRVLYGRIFFWAFVAILVVEVLILLTTYLIFFKYAHSITKETIGFIGLWCVLSTVIALVLIFIINQILSIHAKQLPIKSDEEFALLVDLSNAIKNLELMIYFQPQVDLQTNEITGMEALLRWEHPKFGIIMPTYFIPLAENAGLIDAIGEWILLQACINNKQLLDKGYNLRVAVNVSPLQFKNPYLVENIQKILAITQLPAANLELEITETAMIDDIEYAVEEMNKLRKLGIVLSLDDFGTGYSSLAHVDRLPIDKLKIDKAFVQKINKHAEDSNLAFSIIQMAHKLKLQIIVEGIENEYQKKYFTDLGCHEGQGFYLGAPIPAERFLKYLGNFSRNLRT